MTADHTGEERTFDALPPAHGRGFAQSWWGLTWLRALEETALDGQQLKQGRKYARQGAVGAVSVRPGRITALVRDRDGTPYRADVLLQQLRPESWDRLLDVVSGEAGHLAALLDRDMPPRLVEDAAGAGVELLPGIGDLEPECGCEAWDHCLHTAALCYQMARLLDQDPFVLLLLRGRGERALLDELQVRSAARAAREAPAPASAEADAAPAGVDAGEAYALGAILPPPPAPPAPVTAPGDAPALDGGAAAPEELDIDALEFLVAATAVRAQRALAEALAPGHGTGARPWPLALPELHGAEATAGSGTETGLESGAESGLESGGQASGSEPPGAAVDAVRLAAVRPAPHIMARLADGTGRSRLELEAAVRAWEFGGAEALSVLEETWSPGPEVLARAGERLAGPGRPALRVEHNRCTLAGTGVQLRYGRDGRWWPYRKERGRWWPAGPAEPDPESALATALGETAADA